MTLETLFLFAGTLMLTGLHYPSADLDEPGWSLVSAAVRTLEESWHQKNACDPATLLPAENNPHRPAVLLELLKVDQEFCWQSGERKQVEDYIAEWPELESNAEQVAELIEAECLTRAAAGEGIPTSEDIQHRFPQVWKRVHLAEVEQQARREKQSHQDTIDVAMVDTAIQPVVAPIPEPMPNPPAALQPLAERYIPLQQLGEGGMGTVFRVHDKQLQREVALKIPRDEITNNPEARARFLKEARSAARIKHPNICTIYDTGEVDGTCFLTMELVNGPSLADQVQAGPIPSDQAAATVLKIALALAKIHEAKIIHRDIKPSNVMLEDGEPLLMDFGLARFRTGEQSQTKAGALVGTLPYMSPQQLSGTRANVSSDIYSLGVVLYEMLAGRRPFRGSMLELISAINSSDPPPSPSSLVPDVDPDLEAICQKAMSREPQDRFASAEEFARTLEEYLKPLTTPALETGRAGLSRRSLKTLGAAAGVVLLGLTIFLRTGNGTVQIDIDGRTTTVTIDGEPAEVKAGAVAVPVGSHEIVIIRKDRKKHRQNISIHWRSQTVAVPTHKLHGTVFDDSNGDGKQQRGEEPLPDWLVWLDLNGNGIPDAGEPNQKTDELGHFHFTGLIPDRYVVRQKMKDGWEQTSPDALIYEEDFDTDPNWTTPHPDRYRWDKTAGEYILTQRNVNGSQTEHAHHDLGLAIGSFQLEYDIFLNGVAYASGIGPGLYGGNMKTTGNEDNYARVVFNFADVSPGVQRLFADLPICSSATTRAVTYPQLLGMRSKIRLLLQG